MQKVNPKSSKTRSQRSLLEASGASWAFLGHLGVPKGLQDPSGPMIGVLLGRFWSHFGRQDGSKIDQKSIQKLIKKLIDFWSPKRANLGSQNLPKWSPKWSKIDKMTDFYKKWKSSFRLYETIDFEGWGVPKLIYFGILTSPKWDQK